MKTAGQKEGAGLLERVTQAVRVSGGAMAVDAQGDAVASFNTAFRQKGEGEANAELFALAPDHALLLRALTLRKAEIGAAGEHVILTDDSVPGGALYFTTSDAAGCPALTPELRSELRKVVGSNG